MKAIVVATIGTRDLMFQIKSGQWFNIGDDRMQDGDIIGEQAEVLADLNLPRTSYRDLTHYLLQHQSDYLERIRPVIIGRLLRDRASEIERIYLIGTDQKPEIKQRDKDTLYACQLIQAWVDQVLNPETQNNINTEFIPLGTEGTNPSNFEETFRWWQNVWRNQIKVRKDQPIWLCPKGGVGQAAESGRVSGLSRYGDLIQFFEFKRTPKKNQAGTPSDYSGPFFGTNYLWDRTQQQALRLLDGYDYAEVQDLLESYISKNTAAFGSVPNWIKAGVAWNQGQFETFYRLIKSTLSPQRQQQAQSWWWMGYEQAYIAIVRLEQDNTVEAMLHSYRAIEAMTVEWAKYTFPHDVTLSEQSQTLDKSILKTFPNLLEEHDFKHRNSSCIYLANWVIQKLIRAAIPHTHNSSEFEAFWDSARLKRNRMSHDLGGLLQKELFDAWKVSNAEEFDATLVYCLNTLTHQSYSSLEEASLFAEIHARTIQHIEEMQLQPVV